MCFCQALAKNSIANFNRAEWNLQRKIQRTQALLGKVDPKDERNSGDNLAQDVTETKGDSPGDKGAMFRCQDWVTMRNHRKFLRKQQFFKENGLAVKFSPEVDKKEVPKEEVIAEIDSNTKTNPKNVRKPEERQEASINANIDIGNKEKKITMPPSIEEMNLTRLSRKNSQLVTKKEELHFEKTKEKKNVSVMSKSLDQGLDQPKDPNKSETNDLVRRKMSLPSYVFSSRRKSKVIDWIKDRSWIELPWEGLAKPDKIAHLRTWLASLSEIPIDQSSIGSRLQDIKAQYDTENNPPKPPNFFVPSTDPYLTLKTEEFVMEECKDLPITLHMENKLLSVFSGKIKLRLKNGDLFSGNIESGTRQGEGCLTFKKSHQQQPGIQNMPISR